MSVERKPNQSVTRLLVMSDQPVATQAVPGMSLLLKVERLAPKFASLSYFLHRLLTFFSRSL